MDKQLSEITDLAEKQIVLMEELEQLKAAADRKQKQLRYVEEVLLPNAMAEAEMSSFTLDSGASVAIKRDYTATISAAHWSAAKSWLIENDGDGVIKSTVTIAFDKGDGERAEEAVTLLMESGFAPTAKETIHPQTLKATVKDYIRKGVDLPFDVFGVFEIVKSIVVLPK